MIKSSQSGQQNLSQWTSTLIAGYTYSPFTIALLVYIILLSICAPYKEVVPLLPEEQPVVSGEELLQHLGEWVGEQLVLFPTEKKIKKQDYYNLAGCQCD